MDNLAKLKYWLSLPGNTYPKLAFALDYESDASVRMWFTRNQIPPREVKKVLEIIEPDIKESVRNASSHR